MYIVATTSITSEGLWKNTAVCCLVQRAREGVNGSVFPSEMCSLTNDSQRKELIDQYRLKGLMGIIAPPVLGQVEGRNWLLTPDLFSASFLNKYGCTVPPGGLQSFTNQYETVEGRQGSAAVREFSFLWIWYKNRNANLSVDCLGQFVSC